MIGIMVSAITTQHYWAAGLAGMLGVTTSIALATGLAGTSLISSLTLSGLVPAPLPRRALSQPAREWDLKEIA
jgi:hypothetical protein